MKKRAFIGVLIIFAGVFVAAYPWIRAAYFEHNKNTVLKQWVQIAAEREIVKVYETPAPPPDTGEQGSAEPVDEQPEVWEEDTTVPFDAAYVLENMEGTITIEKINLRYPILRGATKYNLNLSLCAVTGSPNIGGGGNYCIAGHKSRIYGRQFNRLKELKTGDIVNLFDGENSFDYKVVDSMQVSPEDTWVLDDTENESVLTLITCDYSVKPIGRFIVKCELT